MLEDNDDIEIEISISESSNEEDSEKSSNKSKSNNNSDKQKKDPKKKKTSDGVEKKLWSVAKKYKTLLDKGLIPQIAESEEDRIEVSDAYLNISSNRHRQLDARVYQSLTKMQRTRDTKVALEGTTERDRLRMIAWEVKIRTKAIMFMPGDNTLDMDMFNLHDVGGVQIIEGDNKELLVEDKILEGKGIAIMESLPLRKLTKEQRESLKKEFLKKFGGKQFKISELESKIDSIFADLISLLVREKQIMLLRTGKDSIEIVLLHTASERINELDLVNQSIVITPKKTRK
ncbi:MAG: hypothetical protein KAS22_02155 [Candidatus Heimdallarchaeota archaeon]|nr:hypothetical protein [Candidatus Heimdallarchaeota archaeon]